MSELAKEKLYRKELIKAGGEGNTNIERIRSLQNGGGGEQNASPYVLSYFDMVELAQGKVIDVDKLIEVLETKFVGFDNLVVADDDGAYLFTSYGYAGHDGSKYLDLLHIEIDSDDDAEITLNGNHLVSETTTKNLKQILLLNKTAIESVVLDSLYNVDLDTISVVSCAVGDDNIKPYTYSEFKSLFKEPTV